MEQHNGSTPSAFWLLATHTLMGSFLVGCNGASPPTAQSNPAMITAAGTCADPIRINGSAALDDQTTSRATDMVSGDNPTCVGYKTHGADQVYALMLPSSGKLSVSVTPKAIPGQSGFDPVVFVTAACAAQPECLTGADSYGAGSAEKVEHVNATGQDQALFVVVDGYDFQVNAGDYKVAIDLSNP